jgi:antitoxin component of MazEF toxin-antitoxin module
MPLTIQVKLNRVGNSLKITVPIEVLRALKWQAGDTLEIGLTDSIMTVKKSP